MLLYCTLSSAEAFENFETSVGDGIDDEIPRTEEADGSAAELLLEASDSSVFTNKLTVDS